jgi:hypothetical protein
VNAKRQECWREIVVFLVVIARVIFHPASAIMAAAATPTVLRTKYDYSHRIALFIDAAYCSLICLFRYPDSRSWVDASTTRRLNSQPTSATMLRA